MLEERKLAPTFSAQEKKKLIFHTNNECLHYLHPPRILLRPPIKLIIHIVIVTGETDTEGHVGERSYPSYRVPRLEGCQGTGGEDADAAYYILFSSKTVECGRRNGGGGREGGTTELGGELVKMSTFARGNPLWKTKTIKTTPTSPPPCAPAPFHHSARSNRDRGGDAPCTNVSEK